MSFVPPLASIAAVRPVFMIVMGVFLVIIAWRLAKSSHGWATRLIVSGAFLLGFGYYVMMPLYEAGKIPHLPPARASHDSPATAVVGHVLKTVAMNGGWLFFGLGLALHANVFSPCPAGRKVVPTLNPHESAA